MTEFDIYKAEHLAIADLVLCETPEEQAKQWLHYIDGLNTMAALMVDLLSKEAEHGGADS